MNKKLLTIFLSLFLVGILSVSCSNADKTGAGDGNSTVDNSKGIEQFNGNTYVSKDSFDASSVMPGLTTAYLWVSVKDGKIATLPNNNNNTAPVFEGSYMTGPITGSGTDYTFDAGDGKTKGTLNFSSNGSSVTLRYTANPDAPSFENKDIVCNIKK